MPFWRICFSKYEKALPPSYPLVKNWTIQESAMASNENSPSIDQNVSEPNLSSLPTELQLLILRDCLTTPTALFNFGSRLTKKYASRRLIPDATDELFGQDNLSLSIIFTCRLYHTEGWKILFSGNTFSFDLDLRTWAKPIKDKVSRA